MSKSSPLRIAVSRGPSYQENSASASHSMPRTPSISADISADISEFAERSASRSTRARSSSALGSAARDFAEPDASSPSLGVAPALTSSSFTRISTAASLNLRPRAGRSPPMKSAVSVC